MDVTPLIRPEGSAAAGGGGDETQLRGLQTPPWFKAVVKFTLFSKFFMVEWQSDQVNGTRD